MRSAFLCWNSHAITRAPKLAWVAVGCGLLLLGQAVAMEIRWTRMAGQWPVEASPWVGAIGPESAPGILAVNVGGQVMWWDVEGRALGAGQDGTVARLPEGKWTTAPTRAGPAGTGVWIFASTQGRLLALDDAFRVAWQHALPGGLPWGRSFPAEWADSKGLALAYADESGTVTALDAAGQLRWKLALGCGPARAAPTAIHLGQDGQRLLVPAGSNVCCLAVDGRLLWKKNFGAEVVQRPTWLTNQGRGELLVGTAAGDVFALDAQGRERWKCALGETLNHDLVVLPRVGQEPLILCTGLWGNLHAISPRGQRVWTHLFRSKNRGRPLVLDLDGEGQPEVLVPTFHQHVYAFTSEGRRCDDVRLSGVLPSALVPMRAADTGRDDVLVTSTTLLAYRLRPGVPRSPYGESPEPSSVSLTWLPVAAGRNVPSVLVENPVGALLQVEVSASQEQGYRLITGELTARTTMEVPIPSLPGKSVGPVRAVVRDPRGRILQEATWTQRQKPPARDGMVAEGWSLKSVPAYAHFDSRLRDDLGRNEASKQTTAALTLYGDEVDQLAWEVTSTWTDLRKALVSLGPLTREDGRPFGGAVVWREVIPTGSVNGEMVPDALPALPEPGLLTIPGRSAAKLWLSVDAQGASPGIYRGMVTVQSVEGDAPTLRAAVQIEVLELRLPADRPLQLCVWDYLPNRWFGTNALEAWEDMSRHGVSVYPRSTVPPARVDAQGQLQIDWRALDAELARLEKRGRILFHLNQPPIEFASPPTAEEKRGREREYVRALRDHLQQKGRGYDDYAFYLLDEPGLDYGPNVQILVETGRLIRETDAQLRTYTDPVPGLSWLDYDRIEPLVDIWAPNMRLVSGLLSGDPRMRDIQKKHEVWSYECVSQVKSLSPLRYNRANAWRACYFGLKGIGFWTHSTTEVDHWAAGKSINDEYALVYPGGRPVPSVRWEAVRDGLEDVAAIALLQQAVARAAQVPGRQEQVRQARAALRRAMVDMMELSDEAFVESRDFLRAGDRALGHTPTDVAGGVRHRAEIIRWTLALQAP